MSYATGLYRPDQQVMNSPVPPGNMPAGQPMAQPMGQPADYAMPLTGLAGYEDAIMRGMGASLTAMDSGMNQSIKALMDSGRGGLEQDRMYGEQALNKVGAGYDSAINMLTGYGVGGTEAQQLQAALSGALGPEAQAQAYANFQSSPGQDFLVEQAERSINRNAAATGGTGGGNVKKELLRNAIGMAAQDFGNYFNRLGGVADRGMNAASGTANLLTGKGGTEAEILLGRGANELGTRLRIGENVASLKDSAGLNAASLFANTGQALGAVRNQTGKDIASSVGATTSALANLQNTLGSGQSDILAGETVNISNLLSGYGQMDAEQKRALATILANLAVGTGSGMANIQGQIGQAKADGITGKAAGTREGIQDLGKLIAGL